MNIITTNNIINNITNNKPVAAFSITSIIMHLVYKS